MNEYEKLMEEARYMAIELNGGDEPVKDDIDFIYNRLLTVTASYREEARVLITAHTGLHMPPLEQRKYSEAITELHNIKTTLKGLLRNEQGL